MKNLIFAAVIILFSFTTSTEASSNIAGRVGGYFYASLSPHGTWIDIGYGAIAWKPTIMARTWKPYFQGRWIWSDYGWYWYSYEPFGHIVYHYGRWYYDDYYGWIWIPDYEWAPAWVEWRYSDTYIGWAPLSPYGVFSISIGIHFTHNYVMPYTNWHYVHVNHFYSPYLTSYYVAPKYKYRIHSRTKYKTNYAYYNGKVRNNGIDVNFIEKRTGQRIRQTSINTVNDPRQVVYDKSRDITRDGLRTFYVDKNELSRENLRDIEVKISDRRSSLDLSRVELGSTRDLDKERIRRETSREDSREINRQENQREVIRDKNANDERRVIDRSGTENRETRTQERVNTKENDKSNRNDVRQETRKTENDLRRNNTQSPGSRNNEVKVERRESPVQRQESVNRNSEIRRNENPVIQPRSNDVQRKQSTQVQQRNNQSSGSNESVRTERRENTQSRQESRTIERPTQNTKSETRVDTQKRSNSNDSKQNDSNSRTRERSR